MREEGKWQREKIKGEKQIEREGIEVGSKIERLENGKERGNEVQEEKENKKKKERQGEKSEREERKKIEKRERDKK